MGPLTSACCDSGGSDPKGHLPKKKLPLELTTNHTSAKKCNHQGTTLHHSQDIKDLEAIHRAPVKHTSENYQHHDDLQGIENILKAPNKKLKWGDFTISYLIGTGGFGEVFLGELNQNKALGIVQRYAIKRMKKTDVVKKRLTESIRLEKKILEESKCNFITKLYYAFRDDYYLYIVMEWAEGGDTYTLIKSGSPRLKMFKNLGEDGVRFTLGCLILGLEYLHQKNIIYRDLKPENLLIFSDGYVKLTDFGLARELKQNQYTKTLAGTTIYYAPEMVLGYEYGRQIDLWTLGVYSYQMCNFASPFASADIKNKTKVKKLVQNAESHRFWKNEGLSLELKGFIDSLLKFDPKKRLGAKGWHEVKNHPFFTSAGFDWQALQERTMESPLKPILSQFKLGYTPYDSAKMDPPLNLPPSETLQDLMPSWSMKQSCQYT